MNFLSKVVWSEGMHLGPHHFQAQNRNAEDIVKLVHNSLWFKPYGFAGLKLNTDAISNGSVSVLHARGMFEDGLVFDFPDSDAAPAPISIADFFSPVGDSLTVCLAVPLRRDSERNCALPGESPSGSRYVAVPAVVADENSGADERSIFIGRKNLKLLPEQAVGEGMAALPMARVRRDGAGHFSYDPAFIPPCTRADSSEGLMTLAGRLVGILAEKSAALSASANEPAFRQVAKFWFRHAVNSALAPLRHLWASKHGHPEEFFVEMSRLAGALCTFSLESDPSSLPPYQHGNLTGTFQILDHHIRRHLELLIPTNCLFFPLKEAAASYHEAHIHDPRCFGPSQWVLAVRARAGGADIMARVPELIKACSTKFVGELVRRALPGMKLTHVPVPPSAISHRADTQYFALARSGPCWDHLAETRRMGVHVPAEIPDPELELFIVLDLSN